MINNYECSRKRDDSMPKEKIRKMTGVFAAVFAHTGHISRDEAKEVSGLDDSAFEDV